MTQYVIKNTTAGDLLVTDSGGLQHNILPGSSLTVDLTPAWYNTVVATVGVSGVAPVPVTSFKYAVLALAPVATPTDVVVIQGSASNVVRIKRIKLTGQATGQGAMPVQLIRRSAAYNAIGSAVLTAVNAGKYDTMGSAATAVVSTVGTANFTTVGTAVATIEVGRLGMPALGTGTAGDGQRVFWDFDEDANEPLVLRGVADVLAINFTGAAVPAGGVLDISIETVESAT